MARTEPVCLELVRVDLLVRPLGVEEVHGRRIERPTVRAALQSGSVLGELYGPSP